MMQSLKRWGDGGKQGSSLKFTGDFRTPIKKKKKRFEIQSAPFLSKHSQYRLVCATLNFRHTLDFLMKANCQKAEQNVILKRPMLTKFPVFSSTHVVILYMQL